MPRCFFDSHDSETPSEDHTGSNAMGVEAAHVEAQSALAA